MEYVNGLNVKDLCDYDRIKYMILLVLYVFILNFIYTEKNN